jgi:hypothetical protein
MAAPNIINIAAISAKTTVTVAPITATAMLTNSSGSNQIYKINTIMVTNVSTVPVDITVDLFRGAIAYPIAYTITVPDKSTIVLSGKDTPFYLEEGDALRTTASIVSSLNVLVSYEILS